jgi:hypothetical protein
MFNLMLMMFGLIALQEWALLPEAAQLQREHLEALMIALLVQPWVIKQLD